MAAQSSNGILGVIVGVLLAGAAAFAALHYSGVLDTSSKKVIDVEVKVPKPNVE